MVSVSVFAAIMSTPSTDFTTQPNCTLALSAGELARTPVTVGTSSMNRSVRPNVASASAERFDLVVFFGGEVFCTLMSMGVWVETDSKLSVSLERSISFSRAVSPNFSSAVVVVTLLCDSRKEFLSACLGASSLANADTLSAGIIPK